ncbi:MAG: FHA domain-containing protein [Deltaproteobacteria bacterium]|nr:FHA domain-containing protein [Deltaproteobacteria bacterium]
MYPALYVTKENTIVSLPHMAAQILVGRGKETVDIPILDRSCSREQLSIRWEPQGWVLEPLSRKVATSINARVTSGVCPLTHGDVITFGDSRLVFLTHEDMALTSPRQDASTDRFDEAQHTVVTNAEGNAAPSAVAALGEIELNRDAVIGRDPSQAQILLSHVRVSRKHAAIQMKTGQVFLYDLHSSNGTFVNGARISGWTTLRQGDRVDIGPYSLTFTGHSFVQSSREGNLRMVARNLSRTVRSADTGQQLRILDDVSFVIEPNDFVCLLGPSGSGKTTLMNALSARVAATSGAVFLNGVSLYANFAALKEGMALVPQHDVLHEELALNEALSFTARLRLPPDTPMAGVQDAVTNALASVDLQHRAGTGIRNLSGGQKKRASLANETVCRPNLLFLDEVTSGLDEGTDWEIMRLFRRMADHGMTVICVTHTMANVAEFVHKVVVMTNPGVMAFYGTPTEALTFFGVSKLGDIYRKLPDRTADEWRTRYEHSAYYERYVRTPLAQAAAAPVSTGLPAPSGQGQRGRLHEVWRQFWILIQRLGKILLADRPTMAIAAIQAVLVGVLLPLVFGADASLETITPVDQHTPPNTKPFSLVFLLGISCLWYGSNNASKEIVKERPIYLRERDVNLSVLSYLLSKMVVQGIIGVLQVLMLFGLVQQLSVIPGDDTRQLMQMIMAVLTGTSIGLLISAATSSRDQASTLIPIALIPQIVLGGLIVKDLPYIPGIIAHSVVSGFWVYQGMEAVLHGDDARAQFALLVQAAHCLMFCAIAYVVLLVRDARRG